MAERFSAGGFDYDMWSRSGAVVQVLAKSSTEWWASGGGAAFDGRGAAVVRPITVQSSTELWKEARIDGDDGKAYTINVPDHVALFTGDRVTATYVGLRSADNGHIYGLTNHREGHWWTFNINWFEPNYRQTVALAVVHFVARHRWISYLTGMVLLTLLSGASGRGRFDFLVSLANGFVPETVIMLGVLFAAWLVHQIRTDNARKRARERIGKFVGGLSDPRAADEAGKRKAA